MNQTIINLTSPQNIDYFIWNKTIFLFHSEQYLYCHNFKKSPAKFIFT